MKPIILVEHLSKRYVISHQSRPSYDTLRDVVTALPRKLLGRTKTTTEELWALRDVAFDAQPGDRVGVIGRNGAGKSTLLKLLSRITSPTSGRITLRGRVASLLEVGTGFHPELAGRENIFLNGAVLGMSRAEVRKRFDEIVDFAGVERFLDTPVKRYSSGMYVRLAFAVAAHLESEILIIDEVLSVGDAEFQKKCLGKMDDVAKNQGRTLLFVSHNMGAIQQLCNHAVVLMAGEVAFRGDVAEGIRTYLDKCVSAPAGINKDRTRLSQQNQFVTAHTADARNTFTNQYKYDDPIRVCFELFIPEWIDALHVSLSPYDKHRRRIFTIEIPLKEHYRGDPFMRFAVTVPGGFLCAGEYSWMLYIHDPLIRLFELNDGVCEFSILETGSPFAKYSGYDYGCVYPPKVQIETPAAV
jgi:lipopolysaccharide transport system ATP-binding protein